MRAGSNHIIQTLCFDTQATTEDAAHAFADQVRSINTEYLLRKALSEYDDFPGIIRIDQLELDIGNIEPDDFDSIEELISNQLHEMLADKLVCIENDVERNSFTQLQESVVALQTNESGIEILIHYLVTGALPWNINGKPDMEALLLEILQSETALVKRSILLQLNRSKVVERLATAFSFPTICLLAEKIAGREEMVAVERIVIAMKKKLNPASAITVEKELAIAMLTSIYESVTTPGEFDFLFVKQLEILLYKYDAQALRSMVLTLEVLILAETSSARRNLYRLLLGQASQLVLRKECPVEQSLPLIIERTANVDIKAAELLPARREASSDYKTIPADADDYDQDRYFIDNAGLVLLNAALLQKYFEQLGWLKDKTIVDETARHRMILWLDWLTWGEHRIHEYGLLLIKILAGLHPSGICDVRGTLTPHERDAGQEFLETIIHHWTILRNTSIDGLRTTFLQRDGRLIDEDGGWQLHIASKGYDILVDSLPWSFSIIKFPWMAKPLFTQWQTKT